MRQRALTRRALLRGTAAGAAAAVAGCSPTPGAPPAAPPAPPDPETVLLTGVIAAKEEMVALYRRAGEADAATAAELLPFRQRHEAHLAELRRRLPASAPSATPTAPVSPAPTSPAPTPSPSAVSVGALRTLERKAAAARPRQAEGVSPALAQLLACIGACEAVHATALPRTS
ncbi:hypothetical protein [Sphaerisporangium sp. TRM90804]|uniref:hypothetical protein n=1 Tax=Sphaerisporangium sp. TRM90804 TaxID=3031113 RepID=UPI0024496EAD|nr:hypothetical protein [Sphaerisporangium sp. TRM90804]MDH2425205.1 hypothetical protein [Sphaerisporangium sp. TRM90804]